MTILYQVVTLCLIYPTVLSVNNKFPDDFLFGVSTSAYQIEGGYDSRGETVFDHYQALDESLIIDSANAKIACDSYNRYEEDINLLTDLGVDFYRFSIAWSRILPSGYHNKINPDGIRYYNNLINGLLARNITPMVTMYHYDLPKTLQDLGGWVNPTLSDLFEDYARILFENFGDRVKSWVTFNYNLWGCGDTTWPPMLNQSGIAEYMCVKTVLLAHSKVYRLYQRQFRESQKGEIGFVLDGRWFEPGSDSEEDLEAAERVREFVEGIVANPIYGTGDYPKVVKDRVHNLSMKQGFSRSRLPELTPEEVTFIKGTYDFIGVNVYTTLLVHNAPTENSDFYSYEKDLGVTFSQDPNWPRGLSFWLKVVPSCIRNILKWIKSKYNDVPIFITENGFSDHGELEDLRRIEFYQLYLKALLEAIHEDGVNVKGYAAWSLLDNFEWLVGYSERFGLYHVDFADPKRKRTPKSSAKWYKKLIERRQLDDPSINSSKTEL